MTTREFERIEKKIKEVEEKQIKAKGFVEELEKKWRKDGVGGIDDLKRKKEELKIKIDQDKKRLDSLKEKIKELMEDKI